MESDQKLILDYEQTLEQYRMLADIRFKLLEFVPTVSGVAIALLTGQASDQVALPVGILGFFVTLGILFYEIRNTRIYDTVVHRAKRLERLMGMPVSVRGETQGGLFSERPGRDLELFELFKIWHDRGLALIYGAVMGGWGYVIAGSLSGLLGRRDPWVAPLVGVVLAVVFFWEIQRLSGKEKPQPVEDAPPDVAHNHNERLGGVSATFNLQLSRRKE
ncbi:MAG: tripartite tricarboxylate transporter TctB family protein [Chloroflexi bacterium]|nr:MAG: tripartite tricarboxylate transporter TctB family protein [Chloroflexota bacterium]